MQSFIDKEIRDSLEVKKKLLESTEIMAQLHLACEKAIDVYKKGRKILVAGNGGSAADAQHIVAEFVSRFYFDRPGLPAIALTTDTSIITAIGNDYGYEKLFSRQIEANGAKGDIFMGISTSGNSANVIAGLKQAKKQGIFCLSFSGESGGKMKELSDLCICVPSSNTPRVQESHILMGHIICAAVEEALFAKDYKS